MALFELGNIAATMLILRATELLTPALGVQAATSAALMLYLAYNVAATVASLLTGRASDRRGATDVLAAEQARSASRTPASRSPAPTWPP